MNVGGVLACICFFIFLFFWLLGSVTHAKFAPSLVRE